MTSQTPRPPLTRAIVVDAARALIQDEGLDAVSFRRLAQRLGVTAPALYAYVSDKDDLMRSVTADELMSLVARYERYDGESPVETIRRFCLLYVEYAVEHPALYRAIFLYPPWDLGADRSGYGIPPAVAKFAVPYQAVLDAIDEGLLRGEHPLMISLTLWTTSHGLADMLLQGMPSDANLRRRLCELVIDSVLTGLRPA